jgi:hypothetical protein
MTYSIYCVEFDESIVCDLYDYDDYIAAINGCDTMASIGLMDRINLYTTGSMEYLKYQISPMVNNILPLTELIIEYYENYESTCVTHLRSKSDDQIDKILRENLNDDNIIVLHCSQLSRDWVQDRSVDMDYEDIFINDLWNWQCAHENDHLLIANSCWIKIFIR